MTTRIRGDFNGLFGNLLCISHSDSALKDCGEELALREGMELVAYEYDGDEDEECYLVACGQVVPSPHDLRCQGSRWCLQINEEGVRHVGRLEDA